MAYSTGAFANIIAVHFGGSYLVVNVLGSAAVTGSSSPPPFAKFTYTLPKEGSGLISQTVISQQKQSTPGGPTFKPVYFVWSSLLAFPTQATYNISINAFYGNTPQPFPVSPLEGFFQYLNQFSVSYAVPGGGIKGATGGVIAGTFATLVDAQAAGVDITTEQTLEAVRMYLSDGSDAFHAPPNVFGGSTLEISIDVDPSASSALNTFFIFSIPVGTSLIKFTSTVPSNGQTVGWASVFTNQKKAVKARADLSGVADMSVYFPINLASTTLQVTTTGVSKKGTVKIPNGVATAPLPATAPPHPPTS